jgi:hypothetical protein
MFKQVFPIEMKYHIYEAEESGESRLVKSGVCPLDAALI